MTIERRPAEPMPYTAPDYDPDQSGRPAASVPTRSPEAPPASEAGEGSRVDREPTPYVAGD